MIREFEVKSKRRVELIDITPKVNEFVASSGIINGIVLVFSKHTTTAIILNEYEPGLVSDVECFLEEAVPKADYRHNRIDDNASAHLQSILLQNSLTLPIKGSRLDLGVWQKIIFVELDGPRNRTVSVTLIPE